MSMAAESMSPPMTLDALLSGIADAPPLAVSGISSDSRNVAGGEVFLAIGGGRSHGLDYARQVADAGACAIVWDRDTGEADNVDVELPMVAVDGLAARVGEIANRWFDSPSRSLAVSGVTGTNGKTTIAYLVAQCLGRLGKRSAYVGTLGAGIESLSTDTGMTTPACVDLHRMLASFRDEQADCVALEVSSHGIEQGRVDGVCFDSAIFTNLSRDHIDYHGDMRHYGETKARLFLEFAPRHRIVNVDSTFGFDLAARCGDDVVIVSTQGDRAADRRPFVFARKVRAGRRGSRVRVESSWGPADFELPLPGDFNAANALQVLAQLLCWEFPLADAVEALEQSDAPPGRMQRIAAPAVPAVFVDYAHTPAGLEAALRALRPHCKGSLWCVFGCGGDRDHGKRALMGRIATRLSDRPVVTTDNPRSERPGDIIAAVLPGMRKGAVAIEDRATAIAWAIDESGDDDVVLIAGKGHETEQDFGDRTVPFSDAETARAALDARGARRGGSR